MKTLQRYPRAFWLLFAGYIINRTSNGLIWPFLTIYMQQQVNASLTTIGMLISIQAVAGFISTSLVGVAMDRFGRKGIVVTGLLGGSAVLVLMQRASTVEAWAILIALYGIFIPIFSVGGNAIVADIVEEDDRPGAYALIRMAQNIGVGVGPAIGGLLIVASYGLTYIIAAAVNALLAVLILFTFAETNPKHKRDDMQTERGGGYGRLLADRPFLWFTAAYILLEMVITLVFILLPVYTKANFDMPESQYGFLVTINAAMVVFFQFGVTQITRRYRNLPVLVVGSLVYAVGITSIALGSGFASFALSMVVITIGELIVAPTSLALVADAAPPDMRARYMGVFTLTWTIASGVAPMIGGLLNDNIAPAAIWYGGGVMGLAAAFGFYALLRAGMLQEKAKRDETSTLLVIDEN